MRFTYNAAGAAALLSCAAVLTGTSALQAGDVTYERLLKPEPQNWLMNHRDFGSHRFSPLDTINKSNVKNLKLAFAVALGGTSPNEYIEATPLVDDGFMYITDVWGVVYKIDVRSGHARPHPVEDGSRPEEARPQPRRRALEQPRHLGHRPRRPRDRDRQGDRQDRLGQEPARPGRHGDQRGAARAQGLDHHRRLRRRQRRALLARLARSPRPASCNGRPSRSRRPASPAARPGRTRPMPGRPAAARSTSPAPTIRRPT